MGKEHPRRRATRTARDALAAAADDLAVVRVGRSIPRADTVEGVVVGIGAEWVLIAVVDPMVVLDGLVAVRLADVTKVRRCGGADSFVGRALRARGQWPPPGDATLDLDGTRELLITAAAASALVTIHIEEVRTDVCFIGRPVRVGPRVLRLREITPEAEWTDEPSRWRLPDITRVEIGGSYEAALLVVGGSPEDGR